MVAATVPVPPTTKPSSEVALMSLLSSSHLSLGMLDPLASGLTRSSGKVYPLNFAGPDGKIALSHRLSPRVPTGRLTELTAGVPPDVEIGRQSHQLTILPVEKPWGMRPGRMDGPS